MLDNHIVYENQKMNVKISLTLRADVTDIIEFLINKNLLEFIGALPTTEFIKILDALFDYFNSSCLLYTSRCV